MWATCNGRREIAEYERGKVRSTGFSLSGWGAPKRNYEPNPARTACPDCVRAPQAVFPHSRSPRLTGPSALRRQGQPVRKSNASALSLSVARTLGNPCQCQHRIDQDSQPETVQHTWSTRGFGLFLRLGQCGEDTSLAFLPQPIALAADVDRRREVQEPVQDGRCKYLVGEDVAPVAIGLEVRMIEPRP